MLSASFFSGSGELGRRRPVDEIVGLWLPARATTAASSLEPSSAQSAAALLLLLLEPISRAAKFV